MKPSLILGRVSLTLVGFLLLNASLAGVVEGQAAFNFSPGGFSATNVCANSAAVQGCQILTNGSPNQPSVISGGILRLTTSGADQHASAWFSTPEPLNTGFTTAFQFTITSGGGPGDGIALVIQGDPAGTGAIGYIGNGQNMSYGNNDDPNAVGPGNSIRNSLAVELDTFQNAGGAGVGYGDPDGNHIAVQSCAATTNPTAPGPVLSGNSADHNYICPNGKPAQLGRASLSGVSLADGHTHTLTVNYQPPVSCTTTSCNNFSVYLDSTLVLQLALDITQQLSLPNNSAYLGFTSATGAAVEDGDIVSWSYSQLPLAPITITQPVQANAATTFNFSPILTASVDYSKSGISPTMFNGVFMQSTVQVILDQDYQNLVANTPFQGTTCLRQDIGTNPSTGQPTYACVVTTDLCTTPTNSTPLGTNCPGANAALIGTANIFNVDPSQKPITAPGYIMGSDTALSCGSDPNPTACKNLINIFDNITGDPTVTGKTKNFNSLFIPIEGVVQPVTAVTTNPPLHQGWARGPVTVMFNATESPANNTIAKIDYSATGDDLPAPVSGTFTGSTGSILVPAAAAVQGSTVLTYAATDSSGTPERVVTSSAGQLSTALPTFTINFDLTPPALTCKVPAAGWQAPDVGVPCVASDSLSGLADPSQASFNLATMVSPGTETKSAMTSAVTVFDVAGNSTSAGPFGPFWVDKKPPVISAITISPAAPVFGQAVTASYSCSDGGSGVALCGSSTFAGVASTGTLISNLDGSVGTHTFTVNATDLVGNTTATPVTYTVSPGPQLSISPASIAFGNVKIFGINAKTISVKNTGTLPVSFSSIKLTQTESDGGPGREFVMLNLCGSKLAAQKSCTIVIGFVADEIVSATGTVTFVDNAAGSPQQVQISGNVVKR